MQKLSQQLLIEFFCRMLRQTKRYYLFFKKIFLPLHCLPMSALKILQFSFYFVRLILLIKWVRLIFQISICLFLRTLVILNFVGEKSWLKLHKKKEIAILKFNLQQRDSIFPKGKQLLSSQTHFEYLLCQPSFLWKTLKTYLR